MAEGMSYKDIYGDEVKFEDADDFCFQPMPIHQSQPLNERQVPNNAGGFAYQIDDVMRLRRFICLGSEGGTYYVNETELTLQNAENIVKMIENGKGCQVVEVAEEMSVSGRAAKQNPTIFALALCARLPVDAMSADDRAVVRRRAYEALRKICRIPTHLFQFVAYCEAIGGGKTTGWGRGHRNAISKWYLEKDPMDLANAVTKYRQRDGWSHRDLLRLAHPNPKESDAHREIFVYAVKGMDGLQEHLRTKAATANSETADNESPSPHLKYLTAVEMLSKVEDEVAAAALISEHKLVREHVPTQLLNSKLVWQTLLESMPMTAMLRNLAKMTVVNLLTPGSDETKLVASRLIDEQALKRGRIHPFNVLLAHCTYKSGHGAKGSLKWEPVEEITKALDTAFYASFHNVEPTGKRYCIGLDVSGSMTSSIMGSSLSCREASAAMCMLHVRKEPSVEIMAYCDTFIPLTLDKSDTLETAVSKISNLPFGNTDCALPMIWARKLDKKFDVFVIYTDSETWAGRIHPTEALKKYREASGIPDARLIVVGMTSTDVSIADPNDRYMMDVVGFDAAAPVVMHDFVMGLI